VRWRRVLPERWPDGLADVLRHEHAQLSGWCDEFGLGDRERVAGHAVVQGVIRVLHRDEPAM
jgi:hypothetical protein